jgi:hypothetical protein
MIGHFGGIQHAIDQSKQLRRLLNAAPHESATGFFDASTVAKADSARRRPS